MKNHETNISTVIFARTAERDVCSNLVLQWQLPMYCEESGLIKLSSYLLLL